MQADEFAKVQTDLWHTIDSGNVDAWFHRLSIEDAETVIRIIEQAQYEHLRRAEAAGKFRQILIEKVQEVVMRAQESTKAVKPLSESF